MIKRYEVILADMEEGPLAFDKRIAARNCLLFTFVPNAMLPAGLNALRDMKKQGFKYLALFSWCRENLGELERHGERGALWTSYGNVFVHCRGKAPKPAVERDTTILAPYEYKPAVLYKLVEDLCPKLSKIELKRHGPPRAGWEAHEAVAAD